MTRIDLASAMLKFRAVKTQAEKAIFYRDFPTIIIENRCCYTFENDVVVFGNIFIACVLLSFLFSPLSQTQLFHAPAAPHWALDDLRLKLSPALSYFLCTNNWGINSISCVLTDSSQACGLKNGPSRPADSPSVR